MPSELAEIIRSEIAPCGSVTFRHFMELALYHPRHGYYASGRARIGRKGDFFTNVSVGPLYGRLLARQIAEIWSVLGEPREFTLIEQGAAGGELAADVLGGLRALFPRCHEAARLKIVEPFAVLEERQRARLSAVGERAEWVRSLAELHCDTCMHFSNELPDAFPVHVVRRRGGEWIEVNVVEEGGRFVFTEGTPVSGDLREACARISSNVPEGYTTEINLAAGDWIRDVSAHIGRGFVLAVDYGFSREEYFAESRSGGTLSAYSQHQREPDPLARPGETDLTAHVEFDSLIESALSAGLRLEGFTDQHHFMVGLGMEHFADGANATERRAFQTLMHPQMMGIAFKVVAFSKNVEAAVPLAGFRYARTPAGR